MEFYGTACTTLGMSPEEVGRMWVGDALRLQRYWADQPPLHLLVGAYFGVGKQKAPALSDDEFADALGACVNEVPSPTTLVGPPPPTTIHEG